VCLGKIFSSFGLIESTTSLEKQKLKIYCRSVVGVCAAKVDYAAATLKKKKQSLPHLI
jgi:hypothetical protein